MDFGTIQTLKRQEELMGSGLKTNTQFLGYRIMTTVCELRLFSTMHDCTGCEWVPDQKDISQFFGRKIVDVFLKTNDGIITLEELGTYNNVEQVDIITGSGKLRFTFNSNTCDATCSGVEFYKP